MYVQPTPVTADTWQLPLLHPAGTSTLYLPDLRTQVITSYFITDQTPGNGTATNNTYGGRNTFGSLNGALNPIALKEWRTFRKLRTLAACRSCPKCKREIVYQSWEARKAFGRRQRPKLARAWRLESTEQQPRQPKKASLGTSTPSAHSHPTQGY
jgi:hypothetical protein